MTKLQVLFSPDADLSLEEFADYVDDALVPLLEEIGSSGAGPARIKLTHSGPRPPRLSVIPFRREPLALISLWSRGAGELDARRWIERMEPLARDLAAYRVEESTPVAYERSWADGVPTPGVGLLTLFRRRPGLDDQTFIQRWHGGHTPLSLEIHPLWSYVRNVVREPLIAGSPPWEGIVEEHFRQAADLLNPLRFFGGPLSTVPNMARVARDIAGFIEMHTLRSYLAREIFVRSAPW